MTTETQLELSPPPAPRSVPALHGWGWMVQGFYFFKANPVMWIALIIVYLLIIVPLSLLPVIGSLLSALLAPVFSAGFMAASQAASRNQLLEINHLFLGFKQNTAQLVSLGAICLLSFLIIAIFLVLSLDKTVVELIVKRQTPSAEQAQTVLMPMFITAFLLVPVMMAYFFAPVLVGLHKITAIDALKLSFKASVMNMRPFLLYSFICLILIIVATILAAITRGIVLIVFVPMMMASLYASYADIFKAVPLDSPA